MRFGALPEAPPGHKDERVPPLRRSYTHDAATDNPVCVLLRPLWHTQAKGSASTSACTTHKTSIDITTPLPLSRHLIHVPRFLAAIL